MKTRDMAAIGLLCVALLAACATPAPADEALAPTVAPTPLAAVPVAGEAKATPAAAIAGAANSGMTETQTLSDTVAEDALSVTVSDAITPPVDTSIVTSDGTSSTQPAGAADAAGSSAPGAANDDSAEEMPPDFAPPGALQPFTSVAYGFEVAYPSNYILSEATAGALSPLIPLPSAGFAIMNPTLAASDVAELELPDLQIRLFPANGAASLEAWLAAAGRVPPDYEPAQPFVAAQVSGLRVCHTMMMVPGCSNFIMGKEWIYELVPGSDVGESLVDSFKLLE